MDATTQVMSGGRNNLRHITGTSQEEGCFGETAQGRRFHLNCFNSGLVVVGLAITMSIFRAAAFKTLRTRDLASAKTCASIALATPCQRDVANIVRVWGKLTPMQVNSSGFVMPRKMSVFAPLAQESNKDIVPMPNGGLVMRRAASRTITLSLILEASPWRCTCGQTIRARLLVPCET